MVPAARSTLATRETIYTPLTRARQHVRVVGSPQALVAAVGLRPPARRGFGSVPAAWLSRSDLTIISHRPSLPRIATSTLTTNESAIRSFCRAWVRRTS